MRPSSIVFLNDFCIRYIQSEIYLVTHGASECGGVYENTIGYGGGFANSCIYSGSNDYSNGNTVWYNYSITSAGTVTDKNTTSDNLATNKNTAIESVCPNGWSLPSNKQMSNNRNTANFNPVLGGFYRNGSAVDISTRGYWWGSEAYNGATRYYLIYNTGDLAVTNNRRYDGYYIRCVSEEKTVTDLTYMQDYDTTIASLKREKYP